MATVRTDSHEGRQDNLLSPQYDQRIHRFAHRLFLSLIAAVQLGSYQRTPGIPRRSCLWQTRSNTGNCIPALRSHFASFSFVTYNNSNHHLPSRICRRRLPVKFQAGETISQYRIVEEIGQGGMGIVFRAEDTKLRRMVALKFLPPDLSRDSEARDRFIQEAQAASALQHNNICTIHDIDRTEDGQMFIVMD